MVDNNKLNRFLEAVNPKGFDKKPKSVAVNTAVKDILGLPKFKGKVNERQATILYKHFKENPVNEAEADITSEYEQAILNKDSDLHEYYDNSQTVSLTNFGTEFIKAVNGRRESLLNLKNNLSLFDGLKGNKNKKIQINTDKFKSMSVLELRKFTFDYYNKNLKGNKAKIKDHLKEVSFISDSGRKILKPMYKEKAAAIEHIEDLIKNSSYNNWGDRKANDNPTVLGYLNFKSKVVIDGIKRHVRIAITLNRDREKLFKSFDVGAKEKKVKRPGATVVNPKDGGVKPISKNKDTKKINSNKKGLKIPAAIVPQKQETENLDTALLTVIQPEPAPTAQHIDRGDQVAPTAPVKNSKVRNMAKNSNQQSNVKNKAFLFHNQNNLNQKREPLGFSFLVAGTGLEPVTFGL